MTKPDVKLDSSINFILDLLDKNSALLSTEYVNEWKATSTFNESGFFKPSFLVPLPCKQTVKAKEIALFCAFPSCGKKWSKVGVFSLRTATPFQHTLISYQHTSSTHPRCVPDAKLHITVLLSVRYVIVFLIPSSRYQQLFLILFSLSL